MFASSAPGESPPPPLPADPYETVSELEPDVTSTVMPDQGGGGSNDMSVSTVTLWPSSNDHSPLHRLKLGQQSKLEVHALSDV